MATMQNTYVLHSNIIYYNIMATMQNTYVLLGLILITKEILQIGIRIFYCIISQIYLYILYEYLFCILQIINVMAVHYFEIQSDEFEVV
jgi:hypothetical protein